jgi:EpsI family protein
MPERRLRKRVCVTAVLLVVATVLLHASVRPLKVAIRHSLKDMPLTLGEWNGSDLPLTEHILAAAGVDDYINRLYTSSKGDRVEFYVGFYSSQQGGDLIHSPRNCLPASGWEWVHKGTLGVQIPGYSHIVVNDFRISKGIYQDLVLYWYQGRGRVVAGEYQSKFWMIADAITRRRTDGSLVRIVIPIQSTEERAQASGVRFLQKIYPYLSESIPN